MTLNINNFTDSELIIRYANNYNLRQETLDIDMVLKHWNLEKALTKQLLKSTPQNRKKVFYDAYNKLYNELPWLQKTGSINEGLSEQIYQEKWQPILGDIAGKKIYEIGSGNGNLINVLAARGAICIGTELSEKRPDKQPQINLEWHPTDGVHLTDYERKDTYDIVISDQVIEHLHPEDIGEHFENVRQILNPGGRYIFFTPHYYMGPGDVSRIFGCPEAEGMHLKEYKYAEIYKLLKSAGFQKIHIPVTEKHTKALPLFGLSPFLLLERSLQLLTSLHFRKKVYHRLRRPFRLTNEIVISAQK